MEEKLVGTAERELAMGALDEHRRDDRLDAGEYHRRSAAAAGARTRAELDELFTDLPEPHPAYPGVRAGGEGDDRHDHGDDVAPAVEQPADLPELVTPLAARIGRHAGLLSLLAPVFAFALFALTGFRFPILFLLVPVAIGVLIWFGGRERG